MFSVLGSSSSPGWVPCVGLLGKTYNSLSASFHPAVKMDTSECDARGSPVMAWHPIEGGSSNILRAFLASETRDKLQP